MSQEKTTPSKVDAQQSILVINSCRDNEHSRIVEHTDGTTATVCCAFVGPPYMQVFSWYLCIDYVVVDVDFDDSKHHQCVGDIPALFSRSIPLVSVSALGKSDLDVRYDACMWVVSAAYQRTIISALFVDCNHKIKNVFSRKRTRTSYYYQIIEKLGARFLVLRYPDDSMTAIISCIIFVILFFDEAIYLFEVFEVYSTFHFYFLGQWTFLPSILSLTVW